MVASVTNAIKPHNVTHYMISVFIEWSARVFIGLSLCVRMDTRYINY